MIRRSSLLVLAGALALTVVLTACGSSAEKSSPGTTTTTVKLVPAGVNPSKSAEMVCAAEAQEDLGDSLGVKPTVVTTPTWVDHTYSCTYVYPDGSYTLSVKELSSDAETKAYFDHLAETLGRHGKSVPLGQGAFHTSDDSLVVRKDWKVLTVDVSKLPPHFGGRQITKEDAAVAVGATIMGCWTGA